MCEASFPGSDFDGKLIEGSGIGDGLAVEGVIGQKSPFESENQLLGVLGDKAFDELRQ
jgi:hypothetical protein